MRNEQRRPCQGGAAALVLADRSQFTISYTGCHAPQGARTTNQAAFWLIARFGVRPSLADTVAELAGLGGRSS
jgi:hypothetical protein